MRIDCHNHAIPERVLALLRKENVYGVTLDGYRWHGGNHVDFDVVESFREPEAKLAQLQARRLQAAVIRGAAALLL